MNIITVFKESVSAIKRNPLLFVPMLASLIFSFFLSLIFVGSTAPMMSQFSGEQFAANPEQVLMGFGAAAGGAFIVYLITSFISFLAHGMTVVMADTALKGEPATLTNGWQRLVSRIIPLVIGTILVVVIIMFATLLLILPGLIAAFFLMFTLISVMLDGFSPGKAIGQSFKTVSKNFGAVFVTFLIIVGLTLPVMLLNFVLVFIPVLGAILSTLLFSVFLAFVTVFLVRVYHSLDLTTATSPDVEV